MTKTGVALAPTDCKDCTENQYPSLPGPMPTVMPAYLADVLRPQATDGMVSKSAIAVQTSGSEGGVRVDYYTQYKGTGSIAEGWPSKMSWLSFTDMYQLPFPPIRLRECSLRKVQQWQISLREVLPDLQPRAQFRRGDHQYIQRYPGSRREDTCRPPIHSGNHHAGIWGLRACSDFQLWCSQPRSHARS